MSYLGERPAAVREEAAVLANEDMTDSMSNDAPAI